MSGKPVSKPLRILYVTGPGDIIGTYRYWEKQQDDPAQVSVTYSGQFYDVCQNLGATGYAIATQPKKAVYKAENFILEHRPRPLIHARGLLYHLGLVWYGLGILISALRWRIDLAVVANGTMHWFMLLLMPLLGIKVVPSLHCVLWLKHQPIKKSQRILLALDRYLFQKSTAILAVSAEILQQVATVIPASQRLSQVNTPKLVEFLPLYRAHEFNDVQPVNFHRQPFRVLFVGRIERDKGIFDLLQMAEQLVLQGRYPIHFDVCGIGSDLDELQQSVKVLGLEAAFTCHGYCQKVQLRRLFSQSHVVIAPTTTRFVEGFCKVVAEGILVGRPVLTSRVCPALSYVRPGVVEVEPDNVPQYIEALLKLYQDREFYQQKLQGCLTVQSPFYDRRRSWGYQLEQVIRQAFATEACYQAPARLIAPNQIDSTVTVETGSSFK